MAGTPDALFLGLDCGTQSTKAVVLDGSGAAVARASVAHDRDISSATRDGVVRRPGGEVLAPIHMALGSHVLGRVAALSVSAQQHGSIFWTRRGLEKLGYLQSPLPPQDQLAGAFVEDLAPVWMDTSTSAECAEMARRVGGSSRVADVTGSAPYERFTGHQIAKRLKQPRYRDACARISLVSSFLPSLLLGHPAPLDHSDASGMNLLDIWSQQWWPAALEACAEGEDLTALLGDPVPSHMGLGAPSPFAQQRYGLSSRALVAPGSGDNPCTLVGMGITRPQCVGISLGTSDTVFALTDKPVPGAEGHVMCSPLPAQAGEPPLYVAMLCCSNGSLTRDAMRRACLGDSATWADVDAAVAAVVDAGDEAATRIAACFLTPEITPRVPTCAAVLGDFDAAARRGAPVVTMGAGADEAPAFLRRLLSEAGVRGWEPAHVLAAATLGHALSLRAHAERLGVGESERVVVAGGASGSRALVQAIADAFCAPVYAAAEGEAAAVGAALRARLALRSHRAGGAPPAAEAAVGAPQHRLVASPRPGWTRARTDDLVRFVLEVEEECARLGVEAGAHEA